MKNVIIQVIATVQGDLSADQVEKVLKTIPQIDLIENVVIEEEVI